MDDYNKNNTHNEKCRRKHHVWTGKMQKTTHFLIMSTFSFESSRRSFCDIDSPSLISQGNSIKWNPSASEQLFTTPNFHSVTALWTEFFSTNTNVQNQILKWKPILMFKFLAFYEALTLMIMHREKERSFKNHTETLLALSVCIKNMKYNLESKY